MECKPLTVETEPSLQDIRFLEDQINRFNMERTGIHDGVLLSFFIRNAQDRIIAGIYGWTWGGCCEIRYLWVDAGFRLQGHGSRLLAAAESEARARKCVTMLLDTHSFQAPGFYRKMGYEIFASVEDYPRGHQKMYLKKTL
jgi:ribosomal protein S18 acetylase RimI-like enzyme